MVVMNSSPRYCAGQGRLPLRPLSESATIARQSRIVPMSYGWPFLDRPTTEHVEVKS